MTGETLLEILVRARRERLKVALYRDTPESSFALELYQSSGFSVAEHGELEEVLAGGLESLLEEVDEAALPDAAFLERLVEEASRLASRSELSLTLGFGFPSGGKPPSFSLESTYYSGHDNKTHRAAYASGEDAAEVFELGLRQLRAFDPEARAEPRARPSELAERSS